MTDFAIRGPNRICAGTGREILPGDRFVGVLVESGGQWERIDYAKDSWLGPPPRAIAWWNGRIPVSSKARPPTFRDEVLFECLDRLANDNDASRLPFRYVVAILLMRRKKLTFEETRRMPDGTDITVLRDSRTGNLLEIRDPKLTSEQISRVQEEVIGTLAE